MAKKNFILNKPQQGVDAEINQQPRSLSLLTKQTEERPADIFEINMSLNQQIVDQFEQLFGPKWRYRVIKETLQIAGVTLSHGQLNLFTKGKSFHQYNLLALLLVLAHHKKGIEINIPEDNNQIIIK